MNFPRHSTFRSTIFLLVVALLQGCIASTTDSTPEDSSGSNGTTSETPTCANVSATVSCLFTLWSQVGPAQPLPTERSEFPSTYDEANDRMMVFGGKTTSGHLNDIWVLSNATGINGTPTWTKLSPTGTAPAARHSAIALYDASNNRLILFGGVNTSNAILMDLWILTHANGLGGAPSWTEVTTSSTPSVRSRMSGVYDAANNRLILFGGRTCPTNQSVCTLFNEAWVLSFANGLGGNPTWGQLSPTGTSPDPRLAHAAAYDPTNNTMIVFGGNTSTNTNAPASGGSNETWILSNANGLSGPPAWTKLAPAPADLPPARGFHTALYDAQNNRLIIFAGTGADNVVNKDVWILTHANGLGGTPVWTEYDSCPPLITARAGHTAAYATTKNKMIVFAGDSGGSTFVNDLWVFNGANGVPSTPVISVAVSVAATTVCANKKIQLRATAKDAQGNNIEGVLLFWTSADNTLATVDSSGLVTAIGAGTVVIHACSGDICSDAITLTITKDTTTSPGSTGETPTTPEADFVITTTSLPTGDTTSGLPYFESVNATGGVEPCTWAATGLPNGFSVSQVKDVAAGKIVCDTMNISGGPFNHPELIGSYPVTVTGTDNAGRTATKSFTITIVE